MQRLNNACCSSLRHVLEHMKSAPRLQSQHNHFHKQLIRTIILTDISLVYFASFDLLKYKSSRSTNNYTSYYTFWCFLPFSFLVILLLFSLLSFLHSFYAMLRLTQVYLMWDGWWFRIWGGDFVKLGKNNRRKERYDRGSQPGSWLYRLWFNPWESKSIPRANNSIFLLKSFNFHFQRSLHGYI